MRITKTDIPIKIDIPGAKTKLDGGTGDVNIAVGAVVAKNLALHGTLARFLARHLWRKLRRCPGRALRRLGLKSSPFSLVVAPAIEPTAVTAPGVAVSKRTKEDPSSANEYTSAAWA